MKNKITIVGAGMVGSTIAYSLIIQEVAQEIALIDINEKLVESQVMDLEHGITFTGNINIHTGNKNDYIDSSVVIITCGIAQKKNETRIDLIKENSKILKSILPHIFEKNSDAILVIVTNPVDILTKIAVDMFPEKKNQIFGTGTLLDSARFCDLIGKKLNINPKSIHAYILGEHGDSEFPVWSSALFGTNKLEKSSFLSDSEKKDIFNKSKNSAYTIIAGKKSTYYAIASGTAHLIHAILQNKKTIIPVSHLIEDVFGISDVCLSLPVVIGRKGIELKPKPELNNSEQKELRKSSKKLKEIYSKLK